MKSLCFIWFLNYCLENEIKIFEKNIEIWKRRRKEVGKCALNTYLNEKTIERIVVNNIKFDPIMFIQIEGNNKWTQKFDIYKIKSIDKRNNNHLTNTQHSVTHSSTRLIEENIFL